MGRQRELARELLDAELQPRGGGIPAGSAAAAPAASLGGFAVPGLAYRQGSRRCERPSDARPCVSSAPGEDHPRGVVSAWSRCPQTMQAKRRSSRERESTVPHRAHSCELWGGRNLDQFAAGASALVGELAGELAPALGEDRPVEAGLLRDARARLGERAARRAGHRRDVEPLDRDQAVALGQLGREAVDEVSTDSGLACTQAAIRSSVRWCRRGRRRSLRGTPASGGPWRPALRQRRRSRSGWPARNGGKACRGPSESATATASRDRDRPAARGRPRGARPRARIRARRASRARRARSSDA